MERNAQPEISEDGKLALDQYRRVLQQLEDLSLVTIRNYLSTLRQLIARCEGCWHEEQEDRVFTPRAVAPALLMRYLQTTLGLKPSTVNRTLLSLKRYFAWTRKTQIVQSNPASLINSYPKMHLFLGI